MEFDADELGCFNCGGVEDVDNDDEEAGAGVKDDSMEFAWMSRDCPKLGTS